jgi:hypothetical protein
MKRYIKEEIRQECQAHELMRFDGTHMASVGATELRREVRSRRRRRDGGARYGFTVSLLDREVLKARASVSV